MYLSLIMKLFNELYVICQIIKFRTDGKCFEYTVGLGFQSVIEFYVCLYLVLGMKGLSQGLSHFVILQLPTIIINLFNPPPMPTGEKHRSVSGCTVKELK